MSTITNPSIDLSDADWIMVNSSGGKDSQTVLRQVVFACDAQGVNRDKIVVVHATFPEEWEGTAELALKQAEHYGLELFLVKRRTAQGVEESLLDYVRRRRKWPDNKNRYCTSDFKRGPANRILTLLAARQNGFHALRPARIISVFGFRSEESPRRRKMQNSWQETRLSNGRRSVWIWLPIHHWTTTEVWQDINQSGVPHHWAYDKGMPRLSCRFCIFAPKPALEIAAKYNPEMLEEYKQVEREIGHTFRKDLKIADIEPKEVDEPISDKWNM